MYIEEIGADLKNAVASILQSDERVAYPANLTVCAVLKEDIPIEKKDLTTKHWKHLADHMIATVYKDFYRLYTDASNRGAGNGIGIADLWTKNYAITIAKDVQITNIELVAILKGIIVASELSGTSVSF